MPVGYVDAVAAIEHDGRLMVATAAAGHDEIDCGGDGRHDCGESFLHLREFSTGADITRIAGVGGDLLSLIVIDGRLHAVVANWLEPVRCWDLASGGAWTVAVPTEPVFCLATGRHGAQPVVLCRTRRSLLVWDLTTGALVGQHHIEARGIPDAIGQLDGAWVYTVRPADGPPSVHRLDGGAVVAEAAKAGPRPVGMAVSGPVLAVARAAVVELHDLKTGAALPALTGHTRWAELAPVTLSGRPHLVTAGKSGEARLWDLTADPPAGGARHDDPITAAALVPGDEGDMLVTGDREGTLRRWRGRDGQPAGSPLADRAGPVRALAARLGVGRTVLATGGGDVNHGLDGDLRRWDPGSGARLGPAMEGHGGQTHCIVSAEVNGREVFLSGGNDGFLSLWDAITGKRLVHQETGKYPVYGLAVGQIHGRLTAVVSRALHQPIRFIDLINWSQIELSADGDWNLDTVHGLVTGDHGPTMITTSGDATVRVWALQGDVWRFRAREYEAAHRCAIAVTERPRPMIAIGYADRTLELIDPATLTLLAGPVQLPEPATTLAFSTSGDLAACYGTDLAVFATGPHGRPT